MGETNNSFPHTRNNLRYQQVFLGSDIVDPTIVGVCLRKDDLFGGAAQTQTLAIKMGPTSLDYTNLTNSFDGNYSAPPTDVFSGDVSVPEAVGSGTPTDFDFCLPFAHQYVHTPGTNLIIEVVNTSATLSLSREMHARTARQPVPPPPATVNPATRGCNVGPHLFCSIAIIGRFFSR
ncbi:MAG: hypothetical protein ABJC63_08945 [Gemmatimonadales bacterium]